MNILSPLIVGRNKIMRKEKLLALISEIENDLNAAAAKVAIFQLVQGDEAIPKTAEAIQFRVGETIDIELQDLKEYVSLL